MSFEFKKKKRIKGFLNEYLIIALKVKLGHLEIFTWIIIISNFSLFSKLHFSKFSNFNKKRYSIFEKVKLLNYTKVASKVQFENMN